MHEDLSLSPQTLPAEEEASEVVGKFCTSFFPSFPPLPLFLSVSATKKEKMVRGRKMATDWSGCTGTETQQ